MARDLSSDPIQMLIDNKSIFKIPENVKNRKEGKIRKQNKAKINNNKKRINRKKEIDFFSESPFAKEAGQKEKMQFRTTREGTRLGDRVGVAET